jgi:ureidoglycolate lyase
VIVAEALTREAFAPFGDVIETDGAQHYPINQGTTERYHDLARVVAGGDNGRVMVSLFVAEPRGEPLTISMLERHPLGSQAFYPLQDKEWLVVVGKSPAPEALRVFRASGRQGVNYAPGTWHHPLIVFSPGSRFLVVDRGGDGNNLEEVSFAPTLISSSRP